eukprot:g4460.t1
MATPRKLRVCGVPEHFNAPWHQAIKSGQFAAAGLDVQWTDQPGGTGAMAKALNADDTDIAVLLTEGIYKDIVGGGKSKIAGVYVQSPLCWGIHASAGEHHAHLKEVGDLKGQRFAVSRMTSGSHLMAFVCAQGQGWDPAADVKFEIVGDLTGARGALKEGRAEAFMWEKFTTKPLVDAGEFKRVGEVLTPWPCFVVAATDALLASEGGAEAVQKMLGVVRAAAAEFEANAGGASVDYVAAHYGLQRADAQEWFAGSNPVKWACTPAFDAAVFANVGRTLASLGVLSEETVAGVTPEAVFAPFCKLEG